jgi:hypothetical protein
MKMKERFVLSKTLESLRNHYSLTYLGEVIEEKDLPAFYYSRIL